MVQKLLFCFVTIEALSNKIGIFILKGDSSMGFTKCLYYISPRDYGSDKAVKQRCNQRVYTSLSSSSALR